MSKVKKRHDSMMSLKLTAVFKVLLKRDRLAEWNKGNARFKNHLCITTWVFAVAWEVWGKTRASELAVVYTVLFEVKSCHLWCHYWLAVRETSVFMEHFSMNTFRKVLGDTGKITNRSHLRKHLTRKNKKKQSNTIPNKYLLH